MTEHNYKVTEIHLYEYLDYDEKTGEQFRSGYSADFAVNDAFMLQLGTDKEFSIPTARNRCWRSEELQDAAHETMDADELAEQLKLPTDYNALVDMGAEKMN